jgi:hypothetical protein
MSPKAAQEHAHGWSAARIAAAAAAAAAALLAPGRHSGETAPAAAAEVAPSRVDERR